MMMRKWLWPALFLPPSVVGLIAAWIGREVSTGIMYGFCTGFWLSHLFHLWHERQLESLLAKKEQLTRESMQLNKKMLNELLSKRRFVLPKESKN